MCELRHVAQTYPCDRAWYAGMHIFVSGPYGLSVDGGIPGDGGAEQAVGRPDVGGVVGDLLGCPVGHQSGVRELRQDAHTYPCDRAWYAGTHILRCFVSGLRVDGGI